MTVSNARDCLKHLSRPLLPNVQRVNAFAGEGHVVVSNESAASFIRKSLRIISRMSVSVVLMLPAPRGFACII